MVQTTVSNDPLNLIPFLKLGLTPGQLLKIGERNERELQHDSQQLLLSIIRRALRRDAREARRQAKRETQLADRFSRLVRVGDRTLMVQTVSTDVAPQFRARYAGRLTDTNERASVYVLVDGSFGPLNLFVRGGKRKASRRKNIWHRNGVIEPPKKGATASAAQLAANTGHSIKRERSINKMGQRQPETPKHNLRPSKWLQKQQVIMRRERDGLGMTAEQFEQYLGPDTN